MRPRSLVQEDEPDAKKQTRRKPTKIRTWNEINPLQAPIHAKRSYQESQGKIAQRLFQQDNLVDPNATID